MTKIKLIVLIIVAITALMFASGCEIEKEISKSNNIISENNKVTTKYEINFSEAFKNNIGFIDSESGEFVSINQEQMSNYLKKVFDLDRNLNFNEYRILMVPDSLDQVHFFLKTINNENPTTISIINELNYIENVKVIKSSNPINANQVAFALGTKTCECESVSCASDWGCDASIFGGNCSCTSCDGDCKKKSTVTEGYSLKTFNVK